MNNQLKVSIIVPVYNAERYLSQCLDSLLEQRIPLDCYEIICINDGSQDASFSIMKEYSDKYPNVRAVNKENEGVSATRNKGLDLARGKYVWFVDADDWVAKGVLGDNNLSKIFSEEDASVPLVLTSCIELHDDKADEYYSYSVSENEDGGKYNVLQCTGKGVYI